GLGRGGPATPAPLVAPGGKIELGPEAVLADLPRLRSWRPPAPDALVLIGRRHLRSKNSWMGNLPRLARGRERCTLMIHPTDAGRAGVRHGGRARVASRS